MGIMNDIPEKLFSTDKKNCYRCHEIDHKKKKKKKLDKSDILSLYYLEIGIFFILYS